MSNKQPTYSKHVIDIADFMFKNPHKKTAEIISVFCGKFRKTGRTIETYIRSAREYNNKRIRKQESAKDAVLVSKAKDTVKKAIMSREELLEFYSNEIQDYKDTKSGKKKAISVGGVIIMPTFQDAKNAGAEIAKIQGYYAPAKSDVTTNGKELQTLIQVEVIERKEQVDENTDNKGVQGDRQGD